MSRLTQLRFIWILLSLQVCLFSTGKANQPSTIPDDVTDLLRHDKHALLYYPEVNGWLEDAYLITRKKTFHKGLSIPHLSDSWIFKLQQAMDSPEATSRDSVYAYCRTGYLQLIGIFEEELEDLYQISVVANSQFLRNIPFEAFVKYEYAEGESPRFLTEFWALSYLYDLNFERIDKRDAPGAIQWDSSGLYLEAPPPDKGTWLFHRWPGNAPALPPGKSHRFNELIAGGYFTDEALGLSRSEYLDSIRKLDDKSGLDPRIWASSIVYGEIAPTNPPFSFPWWILVPIGLVLVVVFGRRL